MKTIRTTIPCLYRDPATGYLEVKYGRYEGLIPPKVWFALNKRVRKLDEEGYFFPLDAMDAYHDTVNEMEHKADEMPQLGQASMETYLIATIRHALFRFHIKKVVPVRDAYRRVEDRMFAVDTLDNIESEEKNGISLRSLAEALPGVPSYEERRRLAQISVRELLDALDDAEISRAFIAYIVADGRFVEAARLAQIGVNRFYAMWKSWLAAAKTAAENVRVDVRCQESGIRSHEIGVMR